MFVGEIFVWENIYRRNWFIAKGKILRICNKRADNIRPYIFNIYAKKAGQGRARPCGCGQPARWQAGAHGFEL